MLLRIVNIQIYSMKLQSYSGVYVCLVSAAFYTVAFVVKFGVPQCCYFSKSLFFIYIYIYFFFFLVQDILMTPN